MRTNQHNQKVFKVKAIAVAVASAVCLMQGMAYAAPGNTQLPIAEALGYGVTYGTSGAVGNIHQTTKTAVNKWQDFSIGANATVNFTADVKDFNSVNIVSSGKTSEIYGRLNAEGGNVFLANTAGVHISSSAQINVGSLYVTTKDLSNAGITSNMNKGKVKTAIASQASNAAELMSLGSIVSTNQDVTFDGERIVIDIDRLYSDNNATKLVGKSDDESINAEKLTIHTTSPDEVVLGYTQADFGGVNKKIVLKEESTQLGEKHYEYTGYTWVSTLDELQNMKDNLDNLDNIAGYYALANSIDANYSLGESFDPIGTKEIPFTGRFDGLGFSIFALNIDSTSNYTGLFGYVKDATVRNFTLSSGSVKGVNYTGAAVGYAYDSIIENIINTQDVNGRSYVGGIVGAAGGSKSKLTNLINLINVGTVRATVGTAAGENSFNVGGIVGSLDNSKLDGTTYNLGAVIAGDSSAVGGLVGSATNSTIGNKNGEVIYNQLNVTGGHEVGGIVGQIDNSTVQNVANYGDISAKGSIAEYYQYHTSEQDKPDEYSPLTGTKIDYENGVATVSVNVANVGGIVGLSKSTQKDGDKVIGSVIHNTYNEGNVDVTQIPDERDGDYYQAGNVGGVVGRAEDTTISNAENKENYIAGAHNVGGIVGYLSGSSTVDIGLNNGGDITATGARLAEPPENSDGFATERVREPIGESDETFLIGNVGGIVGFLSGEEAQIKNSGNRGSVHSAEITDQSNVLTISKAANVGGIVGKIDASKPLDIEKIKTDTSSATVYNSYNTGDVQGYTGVGGIVGMMYNGAVSRSYNLGEIRSTRKSSSLAGSVDPLNMGGIVGDSTEWTNAKAVIYDVYNAGQIGDDKFIYKGRHVGGVVGRLSGDLAKAYNTADIYNGFNVVGGVVGYWTAGNISSVFNTGNVTVKNYNDARSQVGGLIGAVDLTNGDLKLTQAYNLGTIRSFNTSGSGRNSVAGFVGEVVHWNPQGEEHTLTIENAYTLGNIFSFYLNDESYKITESSNVDVGATAGGLAKYTATNIVYVEGVNELTAIAGELVSISWEQALSGFNYWGKLFNGDNNISDLDGTWRLYEGSLPILNDFRPYASEHLEGDDFKIQYGTAYNPLLTILDATTDTEIKSITLSWDDLNIAGAGGLAVYGADLTLTNFTQDAGSYFGGTIFTDGKLTIESSVTGKDVMLGSASKLYGDSVTIDSAGNVTIYGSVTATSGDISISGNAVEVIGQLVTWAKDYSESIDGVATKIEKLDYSNNDATTPGLVSDVFDPDKHLTTIADNTSLEVTSGESGSISITSENDLDLLYGTVGNGLIQSAVDLTLIAKNSGSIFVDTMLDIGGDLSLTSDGEMLLDFSNIGSNNEFFHRDFLDHFKDHRSDTDHRITVSGNGEFIIALDMWDESNSKFDLAQYDVSNEGAEDHELSEDILSLNLFVNSTEEKEKEGAKNYTSIWISSAEQLNAINAYKKDGSGSGILGYNFALKNDIDASQLDDFVPIGIVADTDDEIKDLGFSGTFNGRDYRIIGLTAEASASVSTSPNTGLFSTLYGTVKNLNIYASRFEGIDTAGAVAGKNSGIIDNVTTLGNYVVATGSGASQAVILGAAGGIAGVNQGRISNVTAADAVVAQGDGDSVNNVRVTAGGVTGINQGSISQVNVLSAVTASQAENSYGLGGVAGLNLSGASIAGAVNTGVTHARYGNTITASSVGGIAGTNLGSISDSYNDGDITGGKYVGGLVGYNNGGSVSNVVNAGDVYGESEKFKENEGGIGGLVGFNSGSVTQASNAGAIDGDYYVGGLVGVNASGATLENLYNSISASITGTDYVGGIAGKNEGKISATSRLVNQGNVVGKSYVGGIAGTNSGTISASLNTGEGTETENRLINQGSVTGLMYVGGIAGQNTKEGVIDNVTNEVLVLQASDEQARYFGGIVGDNYGTVTNATNTNEMRAEGANYVGGIIGYNHTSGALTGNIENRGIVNGYSGVGGIIGLNENTSILDRSDKERLTISNYGNVKATSGGAAGIFYENKVEKISNVDLANYGSIQGGENFDGVSGGLFGSNSGDIINSSLINAGTVTGGGVVGGLIGENKAAATNSIFINMGTVEGGSNVGGLFGLNSGNMVYSSLINTVDGKVTGASNVGGLIGENSGTITGGRVADTDTNDVGYYRNRIVNNGTVIGTGDNVGGLIGTNSGDLVAAYNTGAVSGQTNVGGIVGVNSGTIDQAFNNVMTATNNEEISGDSNVGAIVGSNIGKVTNVYTATGGENKIDQLVGSNQGQGSLDSSRSDTTKWKTYGDNDPILSVFLTSLEVKDKAEIDGREVTLQDYLQLTYDGEEQNVNIADLIDEGFIVAPDRMSAFLNTQGDGGSDLLRNTDGQVNAGSYDNWLTSSQIAASGAVETFNPNNLGYNVKATFKVLKKLLTIDINDAETIVGVPPSLSGSSVSGLQGQLVGAETLGDFTFYIGLSDSANYNRVGVYEGQIGIWIDGTFYANQNGLDFESLASVFKNYLVNIGSGTLTVVEREGFDPEEVTDSYHNFNHLYREGWDEVRSQRERKAELHFIEGGMKIESN